MHLPQTYNAQSWLHVTSFINRFASETASDKLFIAYALSMHLPVCVCTFGASNFDTCALHSTN